MSFHPLPLLSFVALAATGGISFGEQDRHWAFEKLVKPVAPQPGDISWVRNEVDYFVLSALGTAGITPNPRADPLTLARRLTLDLTGLPPTVTELDTFEAAVDSHGVDQAYLQLVDRLLASPHYGERWGRHWLDVARYVQGKTKVAAVDRIDMAEPYRDYVIRALNVDKPYDQFVTEQLAGDLILEDLAGLSAPHRKQAYFDRLAAPGFLSIGPWFADCADPNSLRMDIIDEQIATTTQAFLGLNFGCARCHDHFFDPIPTRDYYALAGIFGSTRILKKNSSNWRDGRYRLTREHASAEEVASHEGIRRTVEGLRAARWQTLTKYHGDLLSRVGPRIDDYRRAISALPSMAAVELEAEAYNGQNNVRRVDFDGGTAVETQRERLQWVGWRAVLPEAGTYTMLLRCAAPESYQVELKIDGKSVATDVSLPPTGGWQSSHMRWISLGHHLFRKGSNDVRLWAQDHSYLPRIDKVRFVRTPPKRGSWLNAACNAHQLDKHTLSQLQFVPHAWPPTIADTERFTQPTGLVRLDAEINQLVEKNPPLPRMLAVEDQGQMTDEPIHLSGDVYNVEKEPVPRGLPTLARHLFKSPSIPKGASGRIQLAKWIVDPRNPLTARVIANRLWQGHFGSGIVATPGDFGLQGAAPTNQKLLDHLAVRLIENGWSLKALHRHIVTSATYQQSSARSPHNDRVDPGNKLLWRYPRRRLEAEALYDSMLALSGKVPRQPGGQPLDSSKSKDRAMYILTSGRSPLGMGIEIRKMLHLFGYDPSGVPVHQRDHSVSAAQSLFWLNNKLPRYYADRLAGKLLSLADLNDEQRITVAFRMVLGHPPGPELMEKSFTYLDHCRIVQDLSESDAWARFCLGLFSSDSFSYLE